jgi:cytochrome c oxidase subunit 2
LTWVVIPLAIVMVIFFWGARVYFYIYRPPPDAEDLYVLGKQWMWKVQHPGGQREINEVHAPLNRPVRLILSSQDVIHSFYVPAFRIKQDVLPGRYTVVWFRATQPGTYHLFCAEYCGTGHSTMVGRVVVLDPQRYQEWLTGSTPERPPAEAGAKLFTSLGCNNCHGVQAPTMAGLFMSTRTLSDGRTVVADEQYLRESILDSTTKIAAGYAPLMPSFRGQLTEEQLMELVAYIKSLREPSQLRKTE